MRFYISWIQDCSYAAMRCHSVFEAPDLATAKKEWRSRTINQNHVSVCPAYGDGDRYEELWELPEFLNDKPKAEIQDFYSPPEVCSFKHGNNCYATTKARPQGCGKANQPYGCYQNRREEWETKWADHLITPIHTRDSIWQWFSKLIGLKSNGKIKSRNTG